MTRIVSLAPPWESGSEFHWGCLSGKSDKIRSPWSHGDHILGASGRDVLRLIISHGRANRGWQRIWVPGYLCQEVVSTIVDSGIECVLYPDIPQIGVPTGVSDIDFRPNDVLFLVNHFGVRAAADLDELKVDVIEDHTHDPWSDWACGSTASYCMASLRKTLPIPDGGVLWSGAGLSLPAQPSLTQSRRLASLQKLAGMALKQKYLAGEIASKDSFRQLYLDGEDHIADGEISGPSSVSLELISHLEVFPWRVKKMENLRLITELLSGNSKLRLLDLSKLPTGQVPLGLLLQLRSEEERNLVRTALIAANIYPAVLWPLELLAVQGVTNAELEFSQTCLSIHVDARYSDDDMHKIATVVLETCTTFSEI